jgi:hypothetical protein
MKRYLFLGLATFLLAVPGQAATASRFTTIVTVEEAIERFQEDEAEAEPNRPNAADKEAIEQKLQECGAALGGEVRAENDYYDFRPAAPLPEPCRSVANQVVSTWFETVISGTRYTKLMSKLAERSFKWRAYDNSVDEEAWYDPLFDPVWAIPARYDSLPEDDQLIGDLRSNKANYHIVAHGSAAVKAFFGYAHNKDHDKQKAYLLKHQTSLVKILLAETDDASSSSSDRSGKWALLILVDKELQAVPTNLYVPSK